MEKNVFRTLYFSFHSHAEYTPLRRARKFEFKNYKVYVLFINHVFVWNTLPKSTEIYILHNYDHKNIL